MITEKEKENDIIIYPGTVSGNPLEFQNVVRWILYYPGIIGGDKKYSDYEAEVCGYSLEPNTVPSMFKSLNIENKISKSIIGNILDYENLQTEIMKFEPDIIFHLAAQPLVRLSYSEPILTYQTNVIGSLNVLEAARKCNSVEAFVNVTTDKCYENKEINRGYREDEPMGGYDMYSSSKGCVEIMSSSFRRSFLQEDGSYAMATARAGNVIGGGDWAADRLIPDCVRYINSGQKNEIRNPIIINQNVVFDYLFVEDMERIIEYFIQHKPNDNIINITPTQSSSLLEIANIVKTFSNKEIKVEIKNPVMNNEYTGDNSLLLRNYPECKFTKLENGLKKLFNYKKNLLMEV